jgi:regulator of replication initiation timing
MSVITIEEQYQYFNEGMNVEKKIDDLDQSACRPRSVEEAVGSHYALQVALKTMKERCQCLQQRLEVVEEENHSLRIENKKRKPHSVCNLRADELKYEPGDLECKIESLEEKVALLTSQKSQLTHHLFMVATENRQLWNRLSHVTQANQNLGSHLSKISKTLSRHRSASSITVPNSQSPTSSLLHIGELNLSSNDVLTKESNNVTKKGSDTDCKDVMEHGSSFAKSSGGKYGFNFQYYITLLCCITAMLLDVCMYLLLWDGQVTPVIHGGCIPANHCIY